MGKSKRKPESLIPPMSADEFNKAIAKLGFSQIGLAKFIGCDTRTARRWEDGDYPVPPPLALALRLMVRSGIKPPAQCLAEDR